MHLLIDSDSLCYAAGFVCNEPGQESLAKWQVDNSINTILNDTKADTYQLYISGSNNFRYQVYKEYKANRTGMVKPIHLQTIREHLITQWGANVSDGNEADDMLGIDGLKGQGNVLAHIDKDIDMISGTHYNFRTKEIYEVAPDSAWRHFFWQMLMGDRADNIPGWDGKMRNKVPKKMEGMMQVLSEIESVRDMWNYVGTWHQASVEDINRYAHCLWIQRKEGDDWTTYLENTTEASGLLDDLTPLSLAHFVPPQDDGPLNMPA